jgi:DNA polymerase-3 subunit delta'
VPFTLIGHDEAVAALVRAVEHDAVAHAYLFTGPAHVGKTLAALQFAQLLNCTGEESRPCGRCRSCERIASVTHPDLEVVGIGGVCDETEHSHTAADSRDIRICQVRRLQQIISRAPYDARYRVVIIDPADAMNDATANALLKTLEEPPSYVVIVLVADHEDMLLETIRSRVRRVWFGGAPRAEIEQALRTRWDLEPPAAAELARLSGGRIGWAVASMQDAGLLEARAEALAAAETLATASLVERFKFAADLGGRYSRDRTRVQTVLEVWQEWWRDLLLIAARQEVLVVNRDRLDRLHALKAQCDVADAARALRAITDARQHLAENASPVLALEAMMLGIPALRAPAAS